MIPLSEKYRPTRFEDVIGQSKAIARLKAVGRDGFGGRAFLFTGPSGCGKTTLARLVADSLADSYYVDERVAVDLTIRDLREMVATSHLYSLGKGGRAFIINECHGLSQPCVQYLLDVLEPGAIPAHVVWCLTTTKDGSDKLFADEMDAHPLATRCHELLVTSQGLNPLFAAAGAKIAAAEGLNGAPNCEAKCRAILNANRQSFRALLGEIEAGALMGA